MSLEYREQQPVPQEWIARRNWAKDYLRKVEYCGSTWKENKNHQLSCECMACLVDWTRAIWRGQQGQWGKEWQLAPMPILNGCNVLFHKHKDQEHLLGSFRNYPHKTGLAWSLLAWNLQRERLTNQDQPSSVMEESMRVLREVWPLDHNDELPEKEVLLAWKIMQATTIVSIAKEYRVIKVLDQAAKNGKLPGFSSVIPAPTTMEGQDVDCLFVRENGEEVPCSIKTARAWNKEELRMYREQRGETVPQIYVGYPGGPLTFESLVIMSAKQVESWYNK